MKSPIRVATHLKLSVIAFVCIVLFGCGKPSEAITASGSPDQRAKTSQDKVEIVENRKEAAGKKSECQVTPKMAEDWKPEDVVGAFYKDCSDKVDSRYFEESVVALAERVRDKYKKSECPYDPAVNGGVRFLAQEVMISDFVISKFDSVKSSVRVEFKNNALHDVDQVFTYQLVLTPNGWKFTDIFFPPTRLDHVELTSPSFVRWLKKDLESDETC